MPEQQQDRAQHDDQQNFGERSPVLKIRTVTRSPNVDRGYHGNDSNGYDLLSQGAEGNNFAEIGTEGDGERGHGAAGNGQKHGPSIKKRGQWAEAIAHINVDAAGFGLHRRQFAIAESAEKREHAAGNPDQRGDSDRIVHLAKEPARDKEDARTDD